MIGINFITTRSYIWSAI